MRRTTVLNWHVGNRPEAEGIRDYIVIVDEDGVRSMAILKWSGDKWFFGEDKRIVSWASYFRAPPLIGNQKKKPLNDTEKLRQVKSEIESCLTVLESLNDEKAILEEKMADGVKNNES